MMQLEPIWQSWAMCTLFRMKLPSPMRVQPSPMGLPAWIDAYSRMMLSRPMWSEVSPSTPCTWGSSPMTEKGKIRVRAPTVVRPTRITWELTFTPEASSTPSPTTL